jgi:hypothetical protein
MFDNDYNRQVERRQKIKRTLVMGIDIGNDFNAVGYMNREGTVLGRQPKLYNSREGFDQFVRITEGLKAKHGPCTRGSVPLVNAGRRQKAHKSQNELPNFNLWQKQNYTTLRYLFFVFVPSAPYVAIMP